MNTHKKTFSIRKALQKGWKAFWQQPWLFVGWGLISAIVSLIPELLPETDSLALSGLFAILSIALLVVGFALHLGGVQFALRAVRGEAIDLSDLLAINQRAIWRFFLVSLAAGVLVFLGLLLFVIPGFIIATALMPVQFVYVDHSHASVKEILQRAWDMTKGVRWKLFWFASVAGVVSLLGLLAVGVGLLVTVPVSMMAYAVVYEHLNKQNNEKPTHD